MHTMKSMKHKCVFTAALSINRMMSHINRIWLKPQLQFT